MRSLFIPALFIFIAYTSCTPPDSVRLQEYVGIPADGLFAHIPVCLLNGGFYLGETIQETTVRTSGFESDSKHISCEGVATKSWVIMPCDTIATCTFKEGRLIGFESLSQLPETCNSVAQACEKLENIYGCLGDLGYYLDEKQSLKFSHNDEVYSEEFSFIQDGTGIKSMRYSIFYLAEKQTHKKAISQI
ncbi:MAG: hypothetical protein WED33_09970 [Bacteroidia bacterium]